MNTYDHAQIVMVDNEGNTQVIYPITTGADVSIEIGNDESSREASTIQKLADILGDLAFIDTEIDDDIISEKLAWSSEKINNIITSLSNSFQDGCDTLVNTCKNQGVTPSSNSPTNIAKAINTIATDKYTAGRTQGQNDVKNSPNTYSLYTKSQYTANYNSGRTQGQNDVKNSPNTYSLYTKTQYDANYNSGYSKGVTDADARANTNSVNYQSGYNAGVAAADGRANPSSVNYQNGYNAGYSKGVTDADARANANSINYQSGYNAGVAYIQGLAGKSALSGVPVNGAGRLRQVVFYLWDNSAYTDVYFNLVIDINGQVTQAYFTGGKKTFGNAGLSLNNLQFTG